MMRDAKNLLNKTLD